MNIEASVLARYSQGAKTPQKELCCAVEYNKELLELLPLEIIEKDYGCGDPSRYIRTGDCVLDLGSGSGKICYIAAQLVGPEGRVIGVDMNDDMLMLARKYQDEMAGKLNGNRIRFVKGYIQDLALDLESMNNYLMDHPVQSVENHIAFKAWQEKQRRKNPLIADQSIDLVISNCVLNLVHDTEKQQLVEEIFRVLKPGGRVAISDIVSDELIPSHLKKDQQLWSGCISGALQEDSFLQTFVDAGFQAITLDKWDIEPWQVIEGIEFRSVTITAVKGEGTECWDRGHAVIYKGPYRLVFDDEGYEYPRGKRIAVCERSYRLLTEGPYAKDFIGICPSFSQDAKQWCAPPGTIRPVSESKAGHHRTAEKQGGCC